MDYFFLFCAKTFEMSKKAEKYNRLSEQLKKLLNDSPTLNAQLATINAILYHKMNNFFWVGFYLVNGKSLHVGPYQGPVACQKLEYPKGVCWKSVLDESTQVVPDVHAFPDHIACDSRSKSEIVIPVRNSDSEIVAVLDIDSDKPDQFDTDDTVGLTKILGLIKQEFLDEL